MTYQCPKGHQSSDSDYCSECGTLIGQSNISKVEKIRVSSSNNSLGKKAASQEICPDCGTPKIGDARFCEVCRHDFQENKTGVAEAIVASQQAIKESVSSPQVEKQASNTDQGLGKESDKVQEGSQDPQASNTVFSKAIQKDDFVILEKLNIVISVDRGKASSCDIETAIKPDSTDRVFPLDLDENLVGRRSASKGIYPEIEINDPGVSHRHLKLVKDKDGNFAVLELGSSNGTELNGIQLEPGVHTSVKAGDELIIGIWTKLKLVSR